MQGTYVEDDFICLHTHTTVLKFFWDCVKSLSWGTCLCLVHKSLCLCHCTSWRNV